MGFNIILLVTLGNRSLLIMILNGPLTAPIDLDVDIMIMTLPDSDTLYQLVGRYPRSISVRGRGISIPQNTDPAYRPVRKNSRGRPTGSRFISQENFQYKYLSAYRSVQAKKHALPTQLNVAMELGISERTLRTYLNIYNAPWPPT